MSCVIVTDPTLVLPAKQVSHDGEGTGCDRCGILIQTCISLNGLMTLSVSQKEAV